MRRHHPTGRWRLGFGLSLLTVFMWGLLPVGWLLMIAVGSFLAGIVITVLGAVYPAREAAKMLPVVALRAEL